AEAVGGRGREGGHLGNFRNVRRLVHGPVGACPTEGSAAGHSGSGASATASGKLTAWAPTSGLGRESSHASEHPIHVNATSEADSRPTSTLTNRSLPSAETTTRVRRAR